MNNTPENTKKPDSEANEVGCCDLLAQISDSIETIQDAIFEREYEFLTYCGYVDFDTLTGFWLGSHNCKFVWITESGQHISDARSTKNVMEFLANAGGEASQPATLIKKQPRNLNNDEH